MSMILLLFFRVLLTFKQSKSLLKISLSNSLEAFFNFKNKRYKNVSFASHVFLPPYTHASICSFYLNWAAVKEGRHEYNLLIIFYSLNGTINGLYLANERNPFVLSVSVHFFFLARLIFWSCVNGSINNIKTTALRRLFIHRCSLFSLFKIHVIPLVQKMT